PDLHPAGVEGIEHISLGYVPVERNRVELRQHRNAKNVGVNAVADGDVNQAVLPGDRHRGFGTFGGERVKAFTLTSAENDAEYLAGFGHNGNPLFRTNIRQELSPACDNASN